MFCQCQAFLGWRPWVQTQVFRSLGARCLCTPRVFKKKKKKSLFRNKCSVSKSSENEIWMTSTLVTVVLYNKIKSAWNLWIELFPFVFQGSKSTASSDWHNPRPKSGRASCALRSQKSNLLTTACFLQEHLGKLVLISVVPLMILGCRRRSRTVWNPRTRILGNPGQATVRGLAEADH